jgi:hypothetical protein
VYARYKSKVRYLANNMQIHFTKSVAGVLATFPFLFLVASISGTNQITQNAIAANGTTNITTTTSLSSTDGSNITLGNPQLNYTEYDKTTSFKPAIVNGTHGIEATFTGYGILNGIKITDNGKAFVTNMSGALHTVARGVLVSGNGSTAGTADHGDQGIGHYGVDGKLRDTGIILNSKATGNLAFLGNMVGIYKDKSDKAGNIITETWFWK